MILDLFKLDGRVAVVTGGRRGLGQSMAWGLAEAGADIVCVSKHGQADEARRLVESAGRRFFDIQCDLSEPEQRRGLIDQAIGLAGHVDILVNNAGDGVRQRPELFPEEAWRRQLELHVTAMFDLSQQVFPHMLKKGRGKIINIGSIMSFEAGLNIPAYAAAKHAIAGLTKSLAVSWSARGWESSSWWFRRIACRTRSRSSSGRAAATHGTRRSPRPAGEPPSAPCRDCSGPAPTAG